MGNFFKTTIFGGGRILVMASLTTLGFIGGGGAKGISDGMKWITIAGGLYLVWKYVLKD